MPRCLALIDGQHYPPVVERTLGELRGEGVTVVAALFLGGCEKTDRPPSLSVPVTAGEPITVLDQLIEAHRPDLVIDLSDEPVLDHRRRFALISVALKAGVAYRGAGYRFDPPPQPTLTDLPTLAVTGTGKRTGKTAVTIELARHWREAGRRVCIVTMGRGGPPDPVILRVGQFEASVEALARMAELGLHAASDYVEDAVFAGVDTIGTYRCGAGVSGETDRHNFAAGVSAASTLGADLVLFEGSGTALPPARADSQVLVMPADIDHEYLRGYLGPFRVRSASAAVVIDPRLRQPESVARIESILNSLNPGLGVVGAGYQLEPTVSVEGRRVVVATTAPRSAKPHLVDDLVKVGASAVTVVHSLSDRTALTDELDATENADLLLVEVKAAAVDVVVPWANRRGMEVGLIHNRVLFPEGGIHEVANVAERAWADQPMTS